MPRKARVVLSNTPHHIVQRGHNRQVVFVEPGDYRYYLDTLLEWKRKLGCRVYAYCLMTNHVHLVIDPGDDESNLSKLMKRLAGKQTRVVNYLERRTGTLWEGRFKSSPIETDRYLLACCRYVEMNPVRAGMVMTPDAYPWSSYKAKLGLAHDPIVDFDPAYLGLAADAPQRRKRYADWVQEPIAPDELKLIRQALQRCQLTGSDRFADEVERRTGCRIFERGQGRPLKKGTDVVF